MLRKVFISFLSKENPLSTYMLRCFCDGYLWVYLQRADHNLLLFSQTSTANHICVPKAHMFGHSLANWSVAKANINKNLSMIMRSTFLFAFVNLWLNFKVKSWPISWQNRNVLTNIFHYMLVSCQLFFIIKYSIDCKLIRI